MYTPCTFDVETLKRFEFACVELPRACMFTCTYAQIHASSVDWLVGLVRLVMPPLHALVSKIMT